MNPEAQMNRNQHDPFEGIETNCFPIFCGDNYYNFHRNQHDPFEGIETQLNILNQLF